ncbi:MAG: GtrA family protein, partial [Spirochaetales bacterium]|nr:GtrA family protein [Spirochaetales bacterium]
TCYKVFKKSVLDRIRITERKFGVEPEITAKVAELAREEGLRIYEVGISYYGRTYEEGKKIGVRDGFEALFCILKYNTTGFAKLIRYGMMGILVALSQFAAIIGLVELGELQGIIGENVANAISIEISLIVAFFLHRSFTWAHTAGSSGRQKGAFMQVLWFHGVSFLSVIVRLGLFYGLSLLLFPYQVNVLIGIAVAVVINFIGYDRLVFAKKREPAL